jgi:L-lactate dehydrogenase complex protein LldG
VLARVRDALGPAPAVPPVRRDYRRSGEHAPGSPALLDLLEDRLLDYRAGVVRCAEHELADVLRRVLTELAPKGRLAVPAGLPEAWTAGRDVLRDAVAGGPGASAAELDETVAAVTACAVAVAETGTIVLDAGPDQGRRALTLVPDLHVCVVRTGQVVQTVPEAVARLDPRRPQTWVSGPSATSDIELSRVEGVHGPRTLHVVLVTA